MIPFGGDGIDIKKPLQLVLGVTLALYSLVTVQIYVCSTFQKTPGSS